MLSPTALLQEVIFAPILLLHPCLGMNLVVRAAVNMQADEVVTNVSRYFFLNCHLGQHFP